MTMDEIRTTTRLKRILKLIAKLNGMLAVELQYRSPADVTAIDRIWRAVRGGLNTLVDVEQGRVGPGTTKESLYD